MAGFGHARAFDLLDLELESAFHAVFGIVDGEIGNVDIARADFLGFDTTSGEDTYKEAVCSEIGGQRRQGLRIYSPPRIQVFPFRAFISAPNSSAICSRFCR